MAARTLLLLVLLLLLLGDATSASVSGEREALLKFKAAVTADPGGVLRDWSPASADHCRWPGVSCGAAGDAVAAPTAEEGGGLMKTLWLGSLFGLWYLFNIYFNIYNKQVRCPDVRLPS